MKIDSPDNAQSVAFIPGKQLCTGCGACVGICPNDSINLKINHKKGLIEPQVNLHKCNKCGLCLKVCPGLEWNTEKLRPDNHAAPTPYLGSAVECYLTCSNNEQVRFNGASGGMVTETILYLLDKGLINGAIVTHMKPDDPLQTETYIARTTEQVLSAQGSKYCPVAACSIFKTVLLKDADRYAFVGLPCQIAALRKAQKQQPGLNQRIPYVLGLFCSRTPNFLATQYLLEQLRVEPSDISAITYRGSGHPGIFRLKLKDGSQRQIKHLHPDYWGFTLQQFFKPLRCWLCSDHSAELADWSFADNWRKGTLDKQDHKGISLVVARTDKANHLLKKMQGEKRIKSDTISPEKIIQQQQLREKSWVRPRLWVCRILGHPVPETGTLDQAKPTMLDQLGTLPEYIKIIISGRKRPFLFLKTFILFFKCLRFSRHLAGKLLSAFKDLANLLSMFRPLRPKTLKNSQAAKILIIGGFGSHDIGDEAMPHADIINLRKYIDDLEIVMATPDPDYTSAYHNERAIRDIQELGCSRHANYLKKLSSQFKRFVFICGAAAEKFKLRLRLWPAARNFLDELSNSDLLFNVGGGNINSVIPRELYKKGTIYLAARILDKPIIISGQTIGPFDRLRDTIWARICLNSTDLITFRDKGTSLKRLKKIGVTKPVLCNAADDAMTLPIYSPEKSLDLLRKELPESWFKTKTRPWIVMNLKGSLALFKGTSRSSDLSREIKLMAKIANQLIENYNANIFFLATDFNTKSDDRLLHRQILTKMHHSEHAVCIENEYNDIILKGIISLADAAIGARYHFCVFAADVLVPFLGMASGTYQQTKLKGLADLCDLQDCYVPEDIEQSPFEDIWPRVENFMKKLEQITQQLSQQVPQLRKRSLIGVKAASRYLNTGRISINET